MTDNTTNSSSTKISFKPYHGQPFKKYDIFGFKKSGYRRIGSLLAPNKTLALAKATENFSHKKITVSPCKGKKYNELMDKLEHG